MDKKIKEDIEKHVREALEAMDKKGETEEFDDFCEEKTECDECGFFDVIAEYEKKVHEYRTTIEVMAGTIARLKDFINVLESNGGRD